MKENEIQVYKNLGTIQMVLDEGKRWYISTHRFFNEQDEAQTLKEARENLEYQEARAKEVQAAISLLKRHRYRVFKEMA